MLKFLLKYKGYIVVIVAVIIVIPVLDSLMSFWLQKLFNLVEPGADMIFIYRTLVAGFLVWILKKILYYVLAVLRTRVICNAKHDVKHNMFVALMHKNTSNISQVASSGEYISIFTNDISLLEMRFYEAAMSLVSDICSIVILASSFVILNPKLGAAVIIFGICTMIVPVLFSKKLNSTSLNYSNKISTFTQKIKEYVVAYPTIKNYAIERTIADKFDEASMTSENAKFDADNQLVLANNVGSMLSWFMQFFAIGLGVLMVVNGEILIGTVIAAKSFASDLADPLQNIIYDINSLRSVKDVVNRLKTLSNITSRDAEAENKLSLPAPVTDENTDENAATDIVFNDVNLKIDNNVLIDHFSFEFKAGKKYLMVGLNGAGKSSVFKTLKKWYGDFPGSISIGGEDLAGIDNMRLSHLVSYMNENVTFFSGTVKENISLFRDCDDSLIQTAAQSAQVNLDLDREIKGDGTNISSGEQRRVEIARSLLSSVKALIFDEVVSTLDIETAYEIEKQALGLQNKTVIFISHNFSGKLMREYDEILVMKNGTLLAHNSYEDLLKSCEYFRTICEIKFGSVDISDDPEELPPQNEQSKFEQAQIESAPQQIASDEAQADQTTGQIQFDQVQTDFGSDQSSELNVGDEQNSDGSAAKEGQTSDNAVSDDAFSDN